MPIVIRCPSCDRSLRVPDNLLGRNVKCPSCSTTFIAEDPANVAPPPAAEEEAPPERPARRRPAEEPEEGYEQERPSRSGGGRARVEDDEEQEEYEDRRRRRRGGGWRRGEAMAAVSGPAIALMVVGILAVVVGVIIGVVNLVVLVTGAGHGGPPPGQPGEPDFAANPAINLLGAVLSLVYGGLITLGAIQMKRLQSYGLALTGCIVALVPLNCCCWLLGLPFGIWGLAVLSRQEVKDAFS